MINTMPDRTLSESDGVRLSTRSGTELTLRAVTPRDGALVSGLFNRLGPDGLRFRYLTGMKQVNAHHVAALIEVDHRHAEHLLAFVDADPQPVGSLMITADPDMNEAEVAIAVAQNWRGKGIGYGLLQHAIDLARDRGLKVLRSVESRAYHDAIEVERTSGFTARAYEGDATLVVLEKRLD